MSEAIELSRHVVPVEWLLWLGGTLIACVVYYIREKFAHNDREHEKMKHSVKSVDSKLLHIIAHHHPQMPPYDDKQESD